MELFLNPNNLFLDINQYILNNLHTNLNNILISNNINIEYFISPDTLKLEKYDINKRYKLSFKYLNNENNNFFNSFNQNINTLKEHLSNIINTIFKNKIFIGLNNNQYMVKNLNINNIEINILSNSSSINSENGIFLSVTYNLIPHEENILAKYLNQDILFKLLSELNYKDIYSTCKVNDITKKMCSNEELWKNLLAERFSPINFNELEKFKLNNIIKKEQNKFYERLFYYVSDDTNITTIKNIINTITNPTYLDKFFKDYNKYSLIFNYNKKKEILRSIYKKIASFILSLKIINSSKKIIKSIPAIRNIRDILIYIYAIHNFEDKLRDRLNENKKTIDSKILNKAMMYAILNNHINIVKLLLNHPKSKYFIFPMKNVSRVGNMIIDSARYALNDIFNILIKESQVYPSMDDNILIVNTLSEIYFLMHKYTLKDLKKKSIYVIDNKLSKNLYTLQIESQFNEEHYEKLTRYLDIIYSLLQNNYVINSIKLLLRKKIIKYLNFYIINNIDKNKAQSIITWLETTKFLY